MREENGTQKTEKMKGVLDMREEEGERDGGGRGGRERCTGSEREGKGGGDRRERKEIKLKC